MTATVSLPFDYGTRVSIDNSDLVGVAVGFTFRPDGVGVEVGYFANQQAFTQEFPLWRLTVVRAQ